MTIPIWVATILVGAVLGGASYIIKLVFDLSVRVTRLEARLNGKENP